VERVLKDGHGMGKFFSGSFEGPMPQNSIPFGVSNLTGITPIVVVIR